MVDLYLPKKTITLPARGAHMGHAGRYKVEVCRPDGTVRESRPWRKNLILDRGLDELAGENYNSLDNMISHLVLGTGTSSPQPEDSDLESPVWESATSGSSLVDDGVSISEPPYYGWSTFQWESDPGDIPAGNYTNFGVGRVPGAGGSWTALWATQLFRDANDNPLTLTLLEGEFLRFTYEIRRYAPEDDFVQTDVDISGVLHTITCRPVRMRQGDSGWAGQMNLAVRAGGAVALDGNNDLIGIGDSFGNTGNRADAHTLGSYTPGSFQREKEDVWDPGSINYSSGTRIVLDRGSLSSSAFHSIWQNRFDPVINKTSDERLILKFKYSWGRHEGD